MSNVIHRDGHIGHTGTPVGKIGGPVDSAVYECHTRKATPEELEYYFGGAKDKPPAGDDKTKEKLKAQLCKKAV